MNEAMKHKIGKLYGCIDELIDEYSEELPEVREAEEKVVDLIRYAIWHDKTRDKVVDACQELASVMERQGFIFGFRYAVELLTGEKCDIQEDK